MLLSLEKLWDAKNISHLLMIKVEKIQLPKRARRRSGGRGQRWGPELRAPQQWREDDEVSCH
jgi:hypothetical protein